MNPHTIEIEQSTKHVRVVVDGVTAADTHRPTILREGKLPARYYIPLDDVRTDLLRDSDATTHCPFKGDASYFSLEVNGKLHEDLLWTYRSPIEGREEIAGLVAFYDERVDLQID